MIEDSVDLFIAELAEFGCDGWREEIRGDRGTVC
jgi:hypothetical protein